MHLNGEMDFPHLNGLSQGFKLLRRERLGTLFRAVPTDDVVTNPGFLTAMPATRL
jgi:hypothetical protein